MSDVGIDLEDLDRRMEGAVSVLRPRLDSRIARSTAPTSALSQTCIDTILDSGTLTVPTWLIGIFDP